MIRQTRRTNYYTFFVAVFLGCTSTGQLGLCFLLFYVQELPKAQPAVILVLKHLRRQDNGLKSNPTNWGSREPNLRPLVYKTKGLSPTPFCGFPWYKPVPPGWFNVRNTHRKWFYGEAGNQPANPGLQGIALLHGCFSQFTIPQRLH